MISKVINNHIKCGSTINLKKLIVRHSIVIPACFWRESSTVQSLYSALTLDSGAPDRRLRESDGVWVSFLKLIMLWHFDIAPFSPPFSFRP
jgi:hypothetical protein